MIWRPSPARKNTLGDLDRSSGLNLNVSYTKQVLDAYKEYSKPHEYQIRNNTICLCAGVLLLVASLGFGFNLVVGDKSKTCDGVKHGVAVVLACITGAAGFVGASVIKP